MTSHLSPDLPALLTDIIQRLRRLEQQIGDPAVVAAPQRKFVWTAFGELEVGVGDQPLYNDTGMDLIIVGARVAVMPGSASNIPTGDDLIVNLNLMGTPMFTDGIVMLDGTDTAYAAPDAANVWRMGAYLTVDILQIGSVHPGRNMTLTVIAT